MKKVKTRGRRIRKKREERRRKIGVLGRR